jgi:diguanylate cyclase (GGDEF)-like protein
MTVSRKFFAGQLAVLAPLVVAVALAGVEGLASVKSDFDRVFTDNITVSHVSTTTAADLARADEIALRLATTTSPAERLSLNATLDQSVVPAVDADLSELQVLHAHDAVAERARVERLVRGWSQFVALRDTGLLGARAIVAPAPNTSNRLAQEISGIFDPLAGITETETALEVSQASQAHARAVQAFDTSRLLIWTIALAAFGLGIGSVLLLTRSIVKRQEVQNEFVDALQVTDSEEVVHDLLKRQVERTIPGSSVVVLNRNNSEDRLEATTPLQDDSLLKQGLASAKPRSCKAVLFARPHAEDPEREPLTRCEVCGKAGRRTTCEPLLVAGEVIGSVLVEHDKPLREQDTTALRESVSQAAPVLANLRNLAVAEFRAATDALTGLPNKRAVQDTIKRMAAQSGRTLAPLSAMMVDLDHFKQINDGYGHGRGDDVLAAVGAALSMTVRASDFVGRNGGDEFIVLLPNTDAERAAGVGEKLRAAIAEITVSDVDRDITASVGIATIPQHARDGDQLVRSADRALYVAKTNGRNEVEIAVAAPRNEPEPETGPGLISA